MNDIRFLITKYSVYILLFSVLFLLERRILLCFFNVKSVTIFNNKFYLYEIILTIINVVILYKCVVVTKI